MNDPQNQLSDYVRRRRNTKFDKYQSMNVMISKWGFMEGRGGSIVNLIVSIMQRGILHRHLILTSSNKLQVQTTFLDHQVQSIYIYILSFMRSFSHNGIWDELYTYI